MAVLDAGCGHARGCSREAPWQQMYIVGVDHDPAVRSNPFCDAKVVGDVSSLPFADGSFDLIHCRWVFEHLSDPLATLRQFARVLRPGGRLLALTPNIFHYATLASRLTPHWFHRWWWKGRYDPFPAHYRANSILALRRLCRQADLHLTRLNLIEGAPHYLTRHPTLFMMGVLYERTVNASSVGDCLRHPIVLAAVPS